MEFLIQIDHSLFNFINQGLSNPFFDWLMPIVRDKNTWIPAYILGALWIIYQKKGKKSAWIIIGVVLAVAMADGFSSHILKPLVARTRPCLLPSFAEEINLVVSRCSGAFSFPSSHAANHFAIAVGLILLLNLKRSLGSVLLLSWAVLVCFAQIYVGVHFPSDILAGIFVGVTSAIITYACYRLIAAKSNQ